jgi:hypothetical protein
MALNYSRKQKMMTKRSTKAELVGVDDSLRYILWAHYFMQEQGYGMDASLLYQDNTSVMLLETNGKANSSKQTKHIKVTYFLLKIRSTKARLFLNTVPPSKCGQTSTPNQSKVWYSESSKDTSWASQRIL